MSLSHNSLVAGIMRRMRVPIKIIFGGDRHSIAGFRRLLRRYAFVIVVDVPAEIEIIAASVQDPKLILIPLGDGDTALSLVQDSSPELKDRIENRPAISTASGMAGIRAMGGCGAQRLIGSSIAKSIVQEQIIPRIFKLYPALAGACVDIDLGGSGGTASLGGLVFGEWFVDQLVHWLGIVVDCQVHITGGITSAGLNRNTKYNAAANAVDTADRLMNPKRSLRKSWRAVFREIPAVGTDRDERDGYVLMAEQAFVADEVQREIMLRAPNQAGETECGSMSTMQLGFATPLDPRFDVAPDLSRSLRGGIQRLLQSPATPIVEELEVTTSEEELPQEPIEHLVERSWITLPEELMGAATQPGISSAAGISVLLTSGTSLDLLNVTRQFASYPQTATEAGKRLSMIRTFSQELAMDLYDAANEVEELEGQLRRALSRLQWSIDLIHPSCMLSWIFAILTTRGYKERRLARTTDAYREIDQERLIAQAKLDALRATADALDAEEEFLVKRLTCIDQVLGRYCLRGEADRAVAYVTALPLDEVFTDLWRLKAEDGDDITLKTICTAVHQVTAHGLAKIMQASEPRLELIAEHIANRRFVKFGPAWGASPPKGEPICVHVLPPIDAKTADKLKTLIKRLDSSIVCVADTAEAAVNLVELYLEPVQEIESLLPGYYASSLAEIMASPDWPLFFPNGMQAIRRLGIELVDGVLVFRPRK